MTYRGVVTNGVVVLEGSKPVEGTIVQVTTFDDSVSSGRSIATHPALGIWKDRTDLPDDPVEASKVLRGKLMGRTND
jgi:hypothetical protein